MNQDIIEAVKNGSLSVPLAEKYLRLYVADIDWSVHIANLWKNFSSKLKDEQLAKEQMKKSIACTILLPFVEKTQIPDPPQNLLFWSSTWKQFNEHQWLDLLIEIFKEDINISINRNKLIQLGVVDPVDISPITRQAYNWIYEKVESSIKLSPEFVISVDVKDKITNLVRAYGGAVICNVFINHKLNVDKVLNWRSGYFFEKQIYKVYSIDQMIKIKTAELNKTNSKYIKKVGAKND